MAQKQPTNFPHQRDKDGLYDSICPRCFAPVARSKPEDEMTELERAHVCNSAFLAERGLLAPAESAGNRQSVQP